ncbi:MAG: hypothetical protein Q4B45_02770 [Coriobacteriia bacterium]|nr:hypothetical protein [Coriobacteriia bacterium]
MKVKTLLISSATLTVVGYLFYTYGLRDDAKRKIEELAQASKKAYSTISKLVEEHQGVVIEDTSSLPNVQATKLQWETLGY